MTGRKETKTKVVIIGAGAAGIGAGEYLKNEKIDFLMIEAQGYVGGRMQKVIQTNYYCAERSEPMLINIMNYIISK